MWNIFELINAAIAKPIVPITSKLNTVSSTGLISSGVVDEKPQNNVPNNTNIRNPELFAFVKASSGKKPTVQPTNPKIKQTTYILRAPFVAV